ncbi:NAD-dependent epimerase/dehydratase family protein [Thermaurantiacus sp.]
MSKRLLLVTGAGGFIGGHVCRLAAASGWAVRGLDLAFPADFPHEAVRGSVTDQRTVASAMSGAAAVVHAAALTALWAPDRRAYARVNAGGTAVVARAARAANARLVHVSSYTVLVAAETPQGATLDETAEWHPRQLLGAYPAAKREAELLLADEVARGLEATIVLPSAPVGPGSRVPTAPMRLITDLVNGRLPAILDRMTNLVDVEAVASGILAALEQGAPGRRYLLSGEDAPLAAIAEDVARLAGVRPPAVRVPAWLARTAGHLGEAAAFLGGREPRAPLTGVRLALADVRFSNARARAELGFAPPPLAETLRRAVAAVQAEE